MKRKAFSIITAVLLSASAINASEPEWKLAWSDEFNGTELDSTVWKRTVMGSPDWASTQSPDPRLVEFRDGYLVLKGMVNPDTTSHPAPYICGGIYTKDTKAFNPGRFEIRARLHGAKGAWPAIWLMPFDHANTPWPSGGEIDIMERLNNNRGAYQTVHSDYTVKHGLTQSPRSSTYSPINRDEFNVYGVDILPDKVVFRINGEITSEYPRIETDIPGQFPFYRPQYILIDMQLGGKWVGEVDPADLPVEMEVDYVRYYLPAEK